MEIRPWSAGDDRLAAAAAAPHLSSAASPGASWPAPAAPCPPGTGGTSPPARAPSGRPGRRRARPAGRLGRIQQGAGVTVAADLAVVVVDAWQRRGVATALIRALLPRAFAAGVRELGADLLPGNTAAQRLLVSLFGAELRSQRAEGTLRFEVSLSLAVVRPDAHRDGPKSTSLVATVPAVRPGAVW